jgi:predicted methyltransferase
MALILETAKSISTPLMLAGLIVGVLFLLLKQIVTKVPSPPKTRSGMLLEQIVKGLFHLALVALVLSFVAYVLPLILSNAAAAETCPRPAPPHASAPRELQQLPAAASKPVLEPDCLNRFSDLRKAKRDAWQKPEEVVSWLGLSGDEIVAEIGSGAGYFIPFLSCAVGKQPGKVFAVELQTELQNALREATPDTNVEVRACSEADPHLPPGSADAILMVNTWHQIRRKTAPLKYVDTLARSLRANGRVLIVDYTAESRQGPPASERVSPQEVLHDFDACGLFRANIVQQDTLGDQFAVLAQCLTCG